MLFELCTMSHADSFRAEKFKQAARCDPDGTPASSQRLATVGCSCTRESPTTYKGGQLSPKVASEALRVLFGLRAGSGAFSPPYAGVRCKPQHVPAASADTFSTHSDLLDIKTRLT